MTPAIQTRYAGCRFRSRLEARWAVFLDHLGAEWLYEPEGYSLPSGPYLPDFLIHPHTPFAFWLEIKPVLPDSGPTAHEVRLLGELAEATETKAFMYCRQPGSPVPLDPDWAATFGRRHHEDIRKCGGVADDPTRWGWGWDSGLRETGYGVLYPGQQPWPGDWWWTDCPLCGRVVLTGNGNITGCPASDHKDERRYTYGANMLPRITTPRLLAAYEAARSARFEHGETPQR